MKLILFFTIWTVASFILAPFIGRFLKSSRREQSIRYPFPSGSILDVKPKDRAF
jgi:hypothetical protein